MPAQIRLAIIGTARRWIISMASSPRYPNRSNWSPFGDAVKTQRAAWVKASASPITPTSTNSCTNRAQIGIVSVLRREWRSGADGG